MYSDDIIVVLTPDKNIRKIEDNLLNAINAVLAPSGDQAIFNIHAKISIVKYKSNTLSFVTRLGIIGKNLYQLHT